jgi:hypothetical protein
MDARSLVAILLSGLITLSPAAAGASDGQIVKGTVYTPTGDTCAYPAAVLETGVRAGWIVAYNFEVEPATWGGSFTLQADHLPADLDITFFGATVTTFSRRSLTQGEAGIVPDGATKAIVCLAVGAPTRFTYQAGSAP